MQDYNFLSQRMFISKLIRFCVLCILFCLIVCISSQAQIIQTQPIHQTLEVKKRESASVYHLRDLRKIKIGMTLREVERKLGQKLKPETEKVGPALTPISENFKIIGLEGQDMQNIGLKFYKRQLYAIFVVYEQNQWADIKSLLKFVSKELKIKSQWKTLLQSGTLDMKEMYFPKYRISVVATGVDYTIYIENKKIMDRFRKEVKAKVPMENSTP